MSHGITDKAAHRACLGLIALFACALFATTPTNGDFWWFDSSRHAMNGVFVRDFLMEGGLLHPISFATAYYRQYPGINIGFYPPFFYMTSAPFLAIFGVSHAVSQAVVALYVLGAGVLTFLLLRRFMDRPTSLGAALCVMALPEIALWARQVQLDVPAITLLLATAYSLVRHLESGSRRWLFATTICLGLAILTRVQAIFAVPAVLFFLFIPRYEPRPTVRVRVLATLLGGLIGLPSVLAAAYFSSTNQSLAVKMPNMPPLASLENWVWYANKLPAQVGWPALVLVLAGIVAIALAFAKQKAPLVLRVALVFLACSWIFFSIVSNKEPRFNLPSLPFLLIAATCGLHIALPRLTRLAVPALAAGLAIQALFFTQVPIVAGFKEAALAAQSLTPKNGKTMISAHRDGSFIYDMRALGDRRDIAIRRADKLFVEINIMRELGIKDRNYDQQAILALLNREDISTIVAQTGYLADQPSMRNLQAMLETGSYYEKVQTIALTGNTRADEKELVVYKRIAQR